MGQSLLAGLTKVENESNAWDKEVAQLVSSLAKKGDIELKTDIKNPMAVAKLLAWADWAESKGYSGTRKIVKDFLKNYMEISVSRDRKGRIEIVRSISAINEKMRTNILGHKQEEI